MREQDSFFSVLCCFEICLHEEKKRRDRFHTEKRSTSNGSLGIELRSWWWWLWLPSDTWTDPDPLFAAPLWWRKKAFDSKWMSGSTCTSLAASRQQFRTGQEINAISCRCPSSGTPNLDNSSPAGALSGTGN